MTAAPISAALANRPVQPFFWGNNGEQLTPQQIAARQQIAAAMMTRTTAPQNVGEGLNSLGQALVARRMMDTSDQAQEQGTQAAGTAFTALGDNPSFGSLESAAANPFLNEGQRNVVDAMLGQRMKALDPSYGLDQQIKQTQLAQAQQDLKKPVPLSSFDTGLYHPDTGEVTPVGADGGQVGSIAKGIERGDLPPTLTGMSRQLAGAVTAQLAADGYDLSGGQIDFKGAEHGAVAANGSPQLRLRQAEGTVNNALDILGGIQQKWTSLGLSGQYTQLNRVSLEAAKRGLLGQQAATTATQLDAQINDIAAEIATVYKGGGTPTNEDLAQARTQLDAAMANGTLTDMMANVKANMQARRDATGQAPVGNGGGQNRYAPGAASGAPQVPAAAGAKTTSTGVQWSVGP